jgi:ELWxxDGT repeat protein
MGQRLWLSRWIAIGGTAALLAATPSLAAEPYLLRDLTPGREGSSFTGIAVLDEIALIARYIEPSARAELWRTDGTSAGTHRIASMPACGPPTHLTVVGAEAWLFARRPSPNGCKTFLLASDGTGLRRLAAVAAEPFGWPAIPFSGGLYFAADDPGRGRELWVTDGSPRGTHITIDLYPGESDGLRYMPFEFGDGVLFGGRAGVGEHGLFLWDSEAATLLAEHLLVDGYDTAWLDGERFMVAYYTAPGLWKTDGTPEGTVQVWNAGYFTSLSDLRAYGDALFFWRDPGAGSYWDVWTSDGTEAGTRALVDVDSGDVSRFVEFGGELIFVNKWLELWATDGTERGTRQIYDFESNFGPYGYEWQEAEGRLYFQGGAIATGRELWSTDGTARGTRPEGDIWLGEFDSFPTGLTAVGHYLVFTANDGQHGRELWALDASP